MSRTIARTALTLTTSLLLLALAALPALAAEGTKPDPDVNPYLVGSLAELGTASLVGIAIGVMAFVMRPAGPATSDDHH